ncbi:MAG: hypothetical protein V7L26_12210 [Nostoc sp.]|uniref:hypothetical protein n=1 Tax=Nostoc sp. TaxID=1180 RepID=UPI002FF28CBA
MNQFKIQNDALYETLREGRRLALSVLLRRSKLRVACRRQAMPKALPLVRAASPTGEEKALRCANKIQNSIQPPTRGGVSTYLGKQGFFLYQTLPRTRHLRVLA